MSKYFNFNTQNSGKYYFLSYYPGDEAMVAEYANALDKKGYGLCYADEDEQDSENMQVSSKIEGCEAVIMFISNSVLERQIVNVYAEYKSAKEKNKKILYVIVEQINNANVSNAHMFWLVEINETQHVNAYDYSEEDCIAHIAKEIDKLN